MSVHRRPSLFASACVVAALGAAAPAYAQFQFPYPPYRYGAPDSSVRVEVTPNDAEVYVDGYYAGLVDDFDGVFQRLRVTPGAHELTIYRDGYRSLVEKVYLSPNSTFKLKRAMEKLGPGEAAPSRPAPAYPPDSGAAGAPPFGGRGGDPRQRARQSRPASPEQPPAGAASKETGRLSLRVQPPDADVLIDGEPWHGTAADQIGVDLSEGRHNVQVRKPGFVGYLTDVQVRRGETTTLDVTLRPQP